MIPRLPVDVHIRLEDASPPTGEALVAGRGATERFVGWLDLLRVLADLFGEQNQDEAERGED